MRKTKYILSLCLVLVAMVVKAQFDDLYFDPETDDSYYYDSDYYDDGDDYDYFADEEEYYDDYEYWSGYDNYYTSRMRRFGRSYMRLGFYN